MVEDINVFKDYNPCTSNRVVQIVDGASSLVTGTRSVQLTKDLHFYFVCYVPTLDCNLLSINKLTRDLQCVTSFDSNICDFQEVDSRKVIGSVEMHVGQYLLKDNNLLSQQVHSYVSRSSLNSVFISIESQIMLWHCRLSHPNFLYLEKLFPHLFNNKSSNSYQCKTCQLAKHTRYMYHNL